MSTITVIGLRLTDQVRRFGRPAEYARRCRCCGATVCFTRREVIALYAIDHAVICTRCSDLGLRVPVRIKPASGSPAGPPGLHGVVRRNRPRRARCFCPLCVLTRATVIAVGMMFGVPRHFAAPTWRKRR